VNMAPATPIVAFMRSPISDTIDIPSCKRTTTSRSASAPHLGLVAVASA
jgi:hypothetical protein